MRGMRWIRNAGMRLGMAVVLAAMLSNAPAATVRLGDASGQPGQTVLVPLSLEDLPGPAGSLDFSATLQTGAPVTLQALPAGPLASDPQNLFYFRDIVGPAGLSLNASFSAPVDFATELFSLELVIDAGAPPGIHALALSDIVLALDLTAVEDPDAVGASLTIVPVPAAGLLMLGVLPALVRRRRRG